MRSRIGWVLGMAVSLGMLAGCGAGSTPSVSSSSEEVTVKGTVMLNGKPMTKGTIQFDASNISRPEAPTGSFELSKDGTFSGTTLIGENSVSVQSPELRTDDLRMNRKEVTLTSGENTVNITLP